MAARKVGGFRVRALEPRAASVIGVHGQVGSPASVLTLQALSLSTALNTNAIGNLGSMSTYSRSEANVGYRMNLSRLS